MKTGKTSCRKRRFDRIGALLALAEAQNARSLNRKECRIYQCSLCGGAYHLTSETIEQYEMNKELNSRI
jgi:hypothetical protein